MADKPAPQPTPAPHPAFGSVYAARPPAVAGDPTQARSEAAANLPSRTPGNDQKQLQAMFKEALAGSPITAEVAALHERIGELEKALHEATTDETKTETTEPTPKPATKKSGKKGK